jgi:hypothetical protein
MGDSQIEKAVRRDDRVGTSAIERTTDVSQTSHHVRKVPKAENSN